MGGTGANSSQPHRLLDSLLFLSLARGLASLRLRRIGRVWVCHVLAPGVGIRLGLLLC